MENFGHDGEDWIDYEAGVWIWEGHIHSSTDPYSGEYDEELVCDNVRKLTPEEWDEFLGDHCGPWDPTDWIAPAPKDDKKMPADLRKILDPEI